MHKRFFHSVLFPAVLFLGLFLVNCDDDNNEPETTISVDKTTLSFEYAGNTVGTITVATNADDWDYNSSVFWIAATKSGNTLSVEVEDNDGGDRIGTITFTAGDKTAEVKVTQTERGPVHFNRATGVYFGKNGHHTGTFTMTFTDGDKKLHLEAFSDIFAVPAEFVPAPGNYAPAASSALYTFTKGGGTANAPTGTYYTDGNQVELITAGSFSLDYSGSSYTITGTFTGTNLTDNSDMAGMAFSFAGPIAFDDRSPALTYADYGDNVAAFYLGDAGNGNGEYLFEFAGPVVSSSYYAARISNLFYDLAADKNNAPMPEGIFRIRSDRKKGNITPGYVEDNTLHGAYEYRRSGDKIVAAATAKYGTLVVKNNGNGTYTVKGYFVGENVMEEGYRETVFECTGKITPEYYEPEVSDFDYEKVFNSSRSVLRRS